VKFKEAIPRSGMVGYGQVCALLLKGPRCNRQGLSLKCQVKMLPARGGYSTLVAASAAPAESPQALGATAAGREATPSKIVLRERQIMAENAMQASKNGEFFYI
jgi:hypothetical protein